MDCAVPTDLVLTQLSLMESTPLLVHQVLGIRNPNYLELAIHRPPSLSSQLGFQPKVLLHH
jgi:hypothetical protein